MLQQTRVETVKPYYERWMQQFPDVRKLAEADVQDVLRLWEGLGYYSRARSIHKAAQKIVTDHNGEIPADLNALRKLPGIGDYTAGAILSIGFGLPAAALDGNIRRILARYYDIAEPVRTPQTEKHLWELAEENLDRERPGDFNEALMDLGSAVCLPENPQCLLCPLCENCLARQHGTTAERPVMPKPEPIPHYIVTAAVIPARDAASDGFYLPNVPTKGCSADCGSFPAANRNRVKALKTASAGRSGKSWTSGSR